jgi:ribonuclease HI
MILTIHCDGSCYHLDGRMGLGIAWFKDDSEEPFYSQAISKCDRKGSSNEAEYLAIINALHQLRRPNLLWDEIHLYSDSQLVINQINGDWLCKGENLQELLDAVDKLLDKIPPIKFHWCPRCLPRQKVADKLSKKANPYFKQTA